MVSAIEGDRFMALRGLAHHLFDVEKRRADRYEVCFRTKLRLIGSEPITADVINISRLGFMARTDAVVKQEDHIHINLLPLGDLRARVVWVLGGRMGAEFTSAIDPVTYYLLLDAIAGNDRGDI